MRAGSRMQTELTLSDSLTAHFRTGLLGSVNPALALAGIFAGASVCSTRARSLPFAGVAASTPHHGFCLVLTRCTGGGAHIGASRDEQSGSHCCNEFSPGFY
jgi:hypothetical protein